MTIYFFDFDDSFSFNILGELANQNIKTQFIERSLHSEFLKCHCFVKDDICFFGPGPGHPDEYPEAFMILESAIKNNIKCIGICLGHQIMMKALGLEVHQSLGPKHGAREEFCFPNWEGIIPPEWIGKKALVQRYNSLSVMKPKDSSFETANFIYNQSEEVVGSWSSLFLSFQFHPESIGTSCPSAFFEAIRNFLYNHRDEQSSIKN